MDAMKKVVVTLSLFFVILTSTVFRAHADDKYWIGETGFWSEDSNWNPEGQPVGGVWGVSDGDHVLIPGLKQLFFPDYFERVVKFSD
jgi:hypothetical protein